MQVRKFVLSSIATLALSIPALSAPLPSDPALDKPVTLAVKGESLEDVVSTLSTQTGAELRVTRDAADQKVTIFVDAKPARDVMTGLETLFGYQWSLKLDAKRRIYDLWVPERIRKERRSYFDRAVDEAFDRIDARMQKRAEEYQTASKGSISDAWRRAHANKDDAKMQSLGTGVFAYAYTQLSRKAKEALRSGYRVILSSESPEPEWQLPAKLSESILDLKAAQDETAHEADCSRFAAVSIEFRSWITAESVEFWCDEHLASDDPSRMVLPNEAPVDHYTVALRDICPLTSRDFPHDDSAQTLGRKVSVDTSEIAEEAGTSRLSPSDVISTGIPPGLSGSVFANRSDILSLLHKKLGIQIISDHYSFWHPMTSIHDWTVTRLLGSFLSSPGLDVHAMDSASKAAKDLWDRCIGVGSDGYTAKWGSDGKFVYMRTADIPMCDAAEVPNRVLRPLQASYAARKWLSIDEMATLALLGDPQVDSLSRWSIPLKLADNSKLFPLGDGHASMKVSALRLYGSLSADQRAKAVNGGVAIADLSSTQTGVLHELTRCFGVWSPFSTIYDTRRNVTFTVSFVMNGAVVCGSDGVPRVESPDNSQHKRESVVGIFDLSGYRVDKPGHLFSGPGAEYGVTPDQLPILVVTEGCSESEWPVAAETSSVTLPGYTLSVHRGSARPDWVVRIPLKVERVGARHQVFGPGWHTIDGGTDPSPATLQSAQ